jgi:hypothetical protein
MGIKPFVVNIVVKRLVTITIKDNIPIGPLVGICIISVFLKEGYKNIIYSKLIL